MIKEEITGLILSLNKKEKELKFNGNLTTAKRYKIDGAKLILQTLLKDGNVDTFTKYARLDLIDGRTCNGFRS